MKRDNMRGELRRLKRQNGRLKQERQNLIIENRMLRLERVVANEVQSKSAGIMVFRRKFLVDKSLGIPEEREREMALWDFEREFLAFLRQSGKIYQAKREDIIDTLVKFCLFPIEEGRHEQNHFNGAADKRPGNPIHRNRGTNRDRQIYHRGQPPI